MRVIVDVKVRQALYDFYEEAIAQHPTLDETTVHAKIDRLLNAMNKLGDFPEKYALAKYNQLWKKKHYRDFISENIHIAYKVVKLETGEKVVYVADAEHSLLHHD